MFANNNLPLIKYFTKKFSELSLNELYDLLALRQDIFVVEQDCPYLDADGKDQESIHVFGLDPNKKLVTYTRIVPKGISYKKYISIGRVVVHINARGSGEGKRLMQESIKACIAHYPNEKIKISAQSHLNKFYSDLGFIHTGEEYLEDGIPHIGMVLAPAST